MSMIGSARVQSLAGVELLTPAQARALTERERRLAMLQPTAVEQEAEREGDDGARLDPRDAS